MSKLKIVLHSNHCRVKTGFGKHMKHLLTYLHNTKKFEIIEFANGRQWGDPQLNNMPWKCIGSLPNNPTLVEQIKSDQKLKREANYGHLTIDQLIKEEKPDIYLGIEDIWGLEPFFKKPWWNKINCLIWTPIDSLPLLDKHEMAANYTNNIIVQASFAQKALSEKGYADKTHLLPVPLDHKNFHKLDPDVVSKIKSKNGISQDDFIIGFVFRNQLRKSVPNLLEGFKRFTQEHPESNAKLLLHTHWAEGWDISKLITEKGINPANVLTTYFCKDCRNYEIKSFQGQDLDCRFCGSKKSQQTTQIQKGVSEKQLNEIYNIMDVYCHPFTSGGQEIPIQEAKLTELITLVTNYSCGEDYSTKESGGIPLEWSEYREPGTQFIKASTDSNDIAEKIADVYNMTPKKKAKMGKDARDFVIDYCSIDSVCSKFFEIVSSMKKVDWDFDMSPRQYNTSYQAKDIPDDIEWLKDLYKNIFHFENPQLEDKKGYDHWVQFLSNGGSRPKLYDQFISSAINQNKKNKTIPFEDLLSKDDKGRRILFCMPENEIDVFNSTSLLKYIKDSYPDHNIYYATKPEYYDLLGGNPYVHKVLPYDKAMDDPKWAEGQGAHKGFFNFALLPHLNTHLHNNFAHADLHKIPYNLTHA